MYAHTHPTQFLRSNDVRKFFLSLSWKDLKVLRYHHSHRGKTKLLTSLSLCNQPHQCVCVSGICSALLLLASQRVTAMSPSLSRDPRAPGKALAARQEEVLGQNCQRTVKKETEILKASCELHTWNLLLKFCFFCNTSCKKYTANNFTNNT